MSKETEKAKKLINKLDDTSHDKVDWTAAWGKKYPILLEYKDQVDIESYANRIEAMLTELETNYGFYKQDAMLVLKDILYGVWKAGKYSLQGTTQGRYLTGGVPPVRFSM